MKGVIGTSPVSVSYLTDLDCWEYKGFRQYMLLPGAPDKPFQEYALLPLDGDPALVIEPGSVEFAKNLWVKDVRGYAPPKKSAVDVLVGAIKDRELKSGKVGLEFRDLDNGTAHALKKSFPKIDFVDCPEFIRIVRMIKTEEEIDRLRKAAEISERAIIRTLSRIKGDSIKAGDMQTSYASEVSGNGALPDHFIHCPKGYGIMADPEDEMKLGSGTFIDFGCIYKSYYSDSGKTVFMGKPKREWLEIYQGLWDSINESKDDLRPGNKVSQVLDNLANRLKKRGLGDCPAHGHAIGREPREHPVVMRTYYKKIKDGLIEAPVDMEFAEDMVINLESPYTIVGTASFHVERTFLINKRSTEELYPQKEALPFVRE